MREFTKPGYDWEMMMYELSEICEEVYGMTYDLQMGERGQGEYDIATTNPDDIDSIQGYWQGMGQGHGYDGKYIEGAKWVPFVEGSLGAEEAIAKWLANEKTISYPGASPEYDRPFDKVGENGEYTFYQPDLDVILCDLAKREEIPHGTWMIKIDW